MKRLFNWFVGCRCNNLSRPFTITRPGQAPEMYVVCLECGQKFAYDWDSMSVGSRVTNLVDNCLP